MPIYEYRCEACRKNFEHLARNVKDVPAQCPSCGGKKLARMLSSFSVSSASRSSNPPSCEGCSKTDCPMGRHAH